MPEDKPKVKLNDLHDINRRYQIQYDRELEDPTKIPETYGAATTRDIGLGNVYQRDKKYDIDITPTRLSSLNSIRAYNQTRGQEWWTGLKNMPFNVDLGIQQQVTGLKALLPNVPEYFKWLVPSFAMADEWNKARTSMMYGADQYSGTPYDQMNNLESKKNQFGEIYKKNPEEAWDLSDSAWWASNGTQLLGSVLEFGITGFGAGSLIKGGVNALTKGILKKGLQQMVKKGASEQALNITNKLVQQGLPQMITAGTMAYTEGALSGAQVYKQVYDELLAGTGDEELAKETASNAAAKTVGINTVLNTALNIYGLGPIFKNIDNVKYGFKALKKGVNESMDDWYKRLSSLPTEYTGNVGRTLAKTVPEMGFEALEEGVNVFAEKVGKGEESFDVKGLYNSLSSDEGTLSMFLGAIGGIGTMTALDNVPKFQKDDRLASNRTIELKEKKKQYGAILTNLKEDLGKINDLTNELKSATEANDNKRIEVAREKLFNISSARYIVNGNSDVLLNTLEEMKNTDNKETNEEGKTAAQLAGLSISNTDNTYKEKIQKKIDKVKEYDKTFNILKSNYGALDEEMPGYLRAVMDLHIERDVIGDKINEQKSELTLAELNLERSKQALGLYGFGDAKTYDKEVELLPEYTPVQEAKKELAKSIIELNKANQDYTKLLKDPQSFAPKVEEGAKEFEQVINNPPKSTKEKMDEETKKNAANTIVNTIATNKNTAANTNTPTPTDVGDGDQLAETLKGNTVVTPNDVVVDENTTKNEKDVVLSELTTTPVEKEFNEESNTIKTIEEEVELAQEYKNEKDKLVSPSIAMAYPSTRTYDEDGTITNTNEYNQQGFTDILTTRVDSGDEITFEIVKQEDWKPVPAKRDLYFINENDQIVLIAREGDMITYEALTRYGDEMAPIAIKDKDGKIISYVHDLSYIRENRVAEVTNLKKERAELKELRKTLLSGETNSGYITYKGRGRLAVNIKLTVDSSIPTINGTKFRLTSEAIKGNVEFVLADSPSDIIDKNGNKISIIDSLEDTEFRLNPGGVYAKLPTPNGSDFYLPLKHLKLKDKPGVDNDGYIDEILNAVQDFVNQQETGYTHSDLKELMGKYLYSTPSSKYIDKATNSFVITKTNRAFVDFDANGGITFGMSGQPVNFIHPEHTPANKLDDLFEKLQKVLAESYININQSTLSDPDFIRANTASNIVSLDLGNGEFSYFDNPVVEFALTTGKKKSDETESDLDKKRQSIKNAIRRAVNPKLILIDDTVVNGRVETMVGNTIQTDKGEIEIDLIKKVIAPEQIKEYGTDKILAFKDEILYNEKLLTSEPTETKSDTSIVNPITGEEEEMDDTDYSPEITVSEVDYKPEVKQEVNPINTKSVTDLKNMFDSFGKLFEKEGITSKDQIDSLNEDQLGELLKNICKKI